VGRLDDHDLRRMMGVVVWLGVNRCAVVAWNSSISTSGVQTSVMVLRVIVDLVAVPDCPAPSKDKPNADTL